MSSQAESNSSRSRHRTAWLLLSFVVLVVLAIGIVAFLRGGGAGSENESLTVGVLLPLSGNLGYVGRMEADGMRLAIDDINQAGGVNGKTLELQFDDSEGKADVAVTAVEKMMTIDDIDVVIASLSSVVLGIKPVVERNNGVLIGCCMHPDFYRDSPNVFRLYVGVEDESEGFVDYFRSVADEGTEVRLAVLYAEVPNVVEQIDDYLRPGLAEVGIEIAVAEPYRLSDSEFRDKVLKIRAVEPTHLLVLGYGFLYPNIFRELKEQQLRPGLQVVGGWGFLYPQLPPDDLEGVIVVGPAHAFERSDEISDFYIRFRERFGYEANFDAVMTYAAIELIAAGMTDDLDLTESLRRMGQAQTLLGDVAIGVEGQLNIRITTAQFKNGQPQRATEVDAP